MDHVVVAIHPFIMRQEVMAYVNGECVKHVDCDLREVDKICYDLCREFNIHQVDMAGNVELCEKIKYNILTTTRFDDFNIEIKFY